MIGIGIRIPQMGKAPFSPASLGTVLSWVKGDDATWDGSAELGAGVYATLIDQGTLGGSFAATANAAPIAVAVGARNVPAFRGTRRASTSVGVASWAFLHNATGNATLTARFYLYDTGGSYRIFGTSAGGAAPGMRIRVTGSKAVAVWSNASADSLTLTSVANVAVGWNTVQITKTAAACGLILNGETAVTGNIGTPSSANPSHVPVLGNTSTGTEAANGLISECVIHNTALTADGLSLMRSYMSGQWSATPSFSLLSLTTNLLGDWNMSKGVTLNGSNVSAVADQGGLNSDMVQGTAANQPLFVSSWRNSKGAIIGNDLTDLLTATLTSGAITQPCTVYLAGQWPAVGTTASYMTHSNAFEIIAREISSGGSFKPEGYSGLSAVAPNANTRSSPFIGRWRFNSASSEIRVEEPGVAVNSATGLNFGANNGTSSFSIGGKSGSATNGFLGHISRVIVYTGTPTGAQEDALMAYLRSEYNVVAA